MKKRLRRPRKVRNLTVLGMLLTRKGGPMDAERRRPRKRDWAEHLWDDVHDEECRDDSADE